MLKRRQVTVYDAAARRLETAAGIIGTVNVAGINQEHSNQIATLANQVVQLKHELLRLAHERFLAERTGAVAADQD